MDCLIASHPGRYRGLIEIEIEADETTWPIIGPLTGMTKVWRNFFPPAPTDSFSFPVANELGGIRTNFTTIKNMKLSQSFHQLTTEPG